MGDIAFGTQDDIIEFIDDNLLNDLPILNNNNNKNISNNNNNRLNINSTIYNHSISNSNAISTTKTGIAVSV